MKKILITSAIIFVLIITGIFAMNIINSDNNDNKQTMVGMILNGSKSDMSWSQSHYEGMKKTADSLGLNVVYRENVAEEESLEIMEGLIEEGCEIIVCNSFGYGDYIKLAAEEYPDVYFFHATGVENSDNVATYFARMYQIRYLSGIVAGLQTETDEIGYVAAFPIDEVKRGIKAFTLGVRSVNPDASVYVRWCNSWTDDEAAALATEQLINNHNIDVLAMHTDSVKPLEVCDENGVMIIGYNVDNSEHYPETYLTSAVWDWENFYTPHIQECLIGKFEGKHYWDGVETGLVSLAPLTKNVKEGTAEAVEKEMEKLQSGTFDVFYGPVADSEGNIRIADGESMTDESMLNNFGWFVEGVFVDEE